MQIYTDCSGGTILHIRTKRPFSNPISNAQRARHNSTICHKKPMTHPIPFIPRIFTHFTHSNSIILLFLWSHLIWISNNIDEKRLKFLTQILLATVLHHYHQGPALYWLLWHLFRQHANDCLATFLSTLFYLLGWQFEYRAARSPGRKYEISLSNSWVIISKFFHYHSQIRMLPFKNGLTIQITIVIVITAFVSFLSNSY